jgi:hypothetical protein
MKTIIRVKRQHGGFTIISNEVLRDRMSLRAKGLLCMILSNVDEWVVTKAWVSQHCTEGRDALKAVFDELIELGYASVEEREKGSDGRFTQRVWTFRDNPDRVWNSAQTPIESAENQERKPVTGNPSPKNTIEEDHLRTCGDAAKERPRNPLSDALAEVCGMDTQCMTTDEWKKVGVSIAAIRKAQPNVTVKDIQSHAANYRTLFKDAVCTPLALRNHWGATASKSSLHGSEGRSGVLTPNEAQNLKERISGHVANPRHGKLFAGEITPKLRAEYDQLVARLTEMSQTEEGQ